MDRNISALESYSIIVKSLSARRAWIEMLPPVLISLKIGVALRKESVDRNLLVVGSQITLGGRSPQGERG